MSSVAVFGGSFDPPHIGHVLAAAWVISTRPITKFLVVPAFDHAFGKDMAPFPHRRRMAELAFSHLNGVEISALEARMGGASYTVNTLSRVRDTHPGWSVHLVIGSDLVEQIPSWHQGDRIEELAQLIVVGRGGHDGPGLSRPAHDLVMPEVSSSDLRARLREGRPIEGLLPHAVARYIARHGLYRA